MPVRRAKTAQALGRYLYERSKHPQAHLPALWLGAVRLNRRRA